MTSVKQAVKQEISILIGEMQQRRRNVWGLTSWSSPLPGQLSGNRMEPWLNQAMGAAACSRLLKSNWKGSR